MAGPPWVHSVLLGAAVLVAVYGLARIGHRIVRPQRPQARPLGDLAVDVARLLMGVAMVAMLVPAHDPVPPVCWAGALTLQAGWLVLRRVGRRAPSTSGHRDGLESVRSPGHHAVGVLAMAMLFAAGLGDSMPDHAGAAEYAGAAGMAADSSPVVPALFWVLALYFLLVAGWTAIDVAPARAESPRSTARQAIPVDRPEGALRLVRGGCDLITALLMAAMFAVMA